MHISTLATELIITLLYAATCVLVAYNVLHFDIRRLIALPVFFTLISGWLQHRDLFAGILFQTQRPFRPGDWVRLGDQVGQVQETGWRSTRIRTRAHEIITVPSDVLARGVTTNYSTFNQVADEIYISLGYEGAPGTIEAVILKMLADIPEVLTNPPPEVGPWEFGDWSIKYRIRYWMANYAHQDEVRCRVSRSLWYVMNRHSIGAPPPATLLPESGNGHVDADIAQQQLLKELRRVDLLAGLSDEELHLVLPSIDVAKFGRGEVLIRQGESGDCFFILRRGQVEVVREEVVGKAHLQVGIIDNASPKNFFGEIALLKGEPRNTTIRAKTDVEVLRIDRDGFTNLFRARPEIANIVASIAASRETSTLSQAAEAAAKASPSIVEQQSKLLQTMRVIFDF
jgi:CRP-like cAMP-binding protein